MSGMHQQRLLVQLWGLCLANTYAWWRDSSVIKDSLSLFGTTPDDTIRYEARVTRPSNGVRPCGENSTTSVKDTQLLLPHQRSRTRSRAPKKNEARNFPFIPVFNSLCVVSPYRSHQLGIKIKHHKNNNKNNHLEVKNATG